MDYKVIHNTSEAFPYAGAIEIPAGHIAKLLTNEADHILRGYDCFVELTGPEYDKLTPNSAVSYGDFFTEPTVIADKQEATTEEVEVTESVTESPIITDPDAVEEVKTEEVKTEEVKTEDKPKRGK